MSDAVDRSLDLLIKELGSVDNLARFMDGEPIIFPAYKGYNAMVHKVSHNRVDVRITGYGSGKIIDDETASLYDKTAAFIVNAKNGEVLFGCGNLSALLPKEMPPKDLSFGAYLFSKNVSDKLSEIFKTILKIVVVIPTLPYWLARWTEDVDEKILYYFVMMFASLIPLSICMFPPNSSPQIISITQFILVESYIIILYISGVIHNGYISWRKTWEVETR